MKKHFYYHLRNWLHSLIAIVRISIMKGLRCYHRGVYTQFQVKIRTKTGSILERAVTPKGEGLQKKYETCRTQRRLYLLLLWEKSRDFWGRGFGIGK